MSKLFRPLELSPPDPSGHFCEWCGKPATVAKALSRPCPDDPRLPVDTGMRVYACSACEHKAEEMTAQPMGKAGGVLNRKKAA